MSFPDIHTCIQLTAENEKLKKKCWKFKEQRDAYCAELNAIKQKAEQIELLRNFVTTRESSTQTESSTKLWHPIQPKKKEETSLKTEIDQTNKLLTLHNQMMRRYEKEVKMNMMHVETITDLNIRISELERILKEEKDAKMALERQFLAQKCHKKSSLQQSTHITQLSGKEKFEKVSKECEKMKMENKKLKMELKELDFGFFEEVEDLKFALKQSAKLNKEYERTLRKICKQFGVPYPHPEKCIEGPS